MWWGDGGWGGINNYLLDHHHTVHKPGDNHVPTNMGGGGEFGGFQDNLWLLSRLFVNCAERFSRAKFYKQHADFKSDYRLRVKRAVI